MSARQYDQNGFFEVKSNPISRVGVFPYLGRQLGLTGDDAGKVFRVYRPAEELGHPDCVASFRTIPVINDHTMLGPTAMQQSPAAVAAEEKGVHGVLGDEVYFKDGWLFGNIKVFSSFLQRIIDAGKRELSAGYRCTYDMVSGVFEGQQYDAVQRNIRGNHVALVDDGRMGPEVAVLDCFTFDLKEVSMADATTPPAGKPAMTVEEITSMLGQIGPQLALLQAAMAKLSAPPEPVVEVDKAPPVGDAEKPAMPGAAPAPAPPPAAAADTEVKAAIAGMDSAIKALQKDNQELRTQLVSASKNAIGEIAQRDALVQRLAPVIGVFDAKDKTLGEVVTYGLEKLKLNAPKGSESAMLDGYLAGRQPSAAVTKAVSAMDAAPTGALAAYLAAQDKE